MIALDAKPHGSMPGLHLLVEALVHGKGLGSGQIESDLETDTLDLLLLSHYGVLTISICLVVDNMEG